MAAFRRQAGFVLSVLGAFALGLSLGLGLRVAGPPSIPVTAAMVGGGTVSEVASISSTRFATRVMPTVTLAIAVTLPEDEPGGLSAASGTQEGLSLGLPVTTTSQSGTTFAAAAVVTTATPTALPRPAQTATPTGEAALGVAIIRAPEGFLGATLRGSPGTSGATLGLLGDGTRVDRLPGETVADGFSWARVRTADGTVGWVVTVVLA